MKTINTEKLIIPEWHHIKSFLKQFLSIDENSTVADFLEAVNWKKGIICSLIKDYSMQENKKIMGWLVFDKYEFTPDCPFYIEVLKDLYKILELNK